MIANFQTLFFGNVVLFEKGFSSQCYGYLVQLGYNTVTKVGKDLFTLSFSSFPFKNLKNRLCSAVSN